ncbi:MAG: glutamate synthase large subunit [Leptolyngbyaceae cyanobacterium bins.302]|nr:glutamate synthase large subunit [Leptolyngbyaceae cyanobacterium bins.302]
MNNQQLPSKQGLYDPQFEHDACGVGFIVHMKGQKSHDIVEQGLTILLNIDHRGAVGAEINTGDGAGILMQIPHKFLQKITAVQNITLPAPGQYGVGMVYASPDATQRAAGRREFEQIVAAEGLQVLGWRDVPTDNSSLGNTAKSSEPFMQQVFIQRSPDLVDDLAFERKLYVIRKRSHNVIRAPKIDPYWYPTSISCRTLVYKGMLMPVQVGQYFPELHDPDMESALALVHSRFSTNTFPSWERSHPYRYIAHNGEINTLRGNINWMHARQSLFESELFGEDIKKIQPVINIDGSDSLIFDNALELLTLAGRSLPHAVMMMIPEPWTAHESMSDEKKAFYEYHSCLMEPWDGPASIAFTDGTMMGAVLDRNGLRPSRYYVTKDDLVIMASEAGVLPIEPERVAYKGRLQPGRMFLVNMEEGRIVADEEIKNSIATAQPYRDWLNQHLVDLSQLPDPVRANGNSPLQSPQPNDIIHLQTAFGYTFEDLRILLTPMARDGVEAVGSMGSDTPLAVLSDRPKLLYDYFQQLFAQVTNPPIDSIREEIITSAETTLGAEKNLLKPEPESCHLIRLKTPILTDTELAKLKGVHQDGFKSVTIASLFDPKAGVVGLEAAIQAICLQADEAIADEANILILSDRGVDQTHAPIPALLAVAALHHHLIRNGTRTRVGLVLESGEPREVHHFATLVGYGCCAINPYLAFESMQEMIEQGLLVGVDHPTAIKNYIKAATKGVVKVASKIGISTIQSYRGAQIFEAIGLDRSVVDKYFTWTASRIEGADLNVIAQEAILRHSHAFPDREVNGHTLDVGGEYQWRKEGEAHLFSPETIHTLQKAVRTGNYTFYKTYAGLVNEQNQKHFTLRGLLQFKQREAIPIEEVEPIESIMRRFKTGAMSYGSISKEAHEALAIAMNRIGGKSNTGEGGEDPERYTWTNDQGDSKNSAIKQVASGRFGVTSLYLSQAREIQIKMAQGAKPGEGGQLPGKKVYPWIAKVRHSTPGVGLISPPPHHDIYSIEDLAQLIHDLKNANRAARISVKLVSEVGVGTVAAGVAKAHADVVLISGFDGGTGASPQTSIKHAGLPWELGLAETHQTLVLNDLRSRIVVETDGQMKTGRDVVIAALLGAEEFGFATAPLVSLGCIMMRVCHLNTCPAGVATQDPHLRQNFIGDPDHTVNFMKFIAQEVREIMAELGFRTIDEMVGRTDILEAKQAIAHWKAKGLDISPILYQPDVPATVGRYCQMAQDHGLDKSLDITKLLELCQPAIEKGEKVHVGVNGDAPLPIKNINRTVGTILGNEITKRHWHGLPEDTVHLKFQGSAGQSFGAFVPKGVTLELEGDANDYVGKGLSGGKLILYPPKTSSFVAEHNIIVGNVALYGATSGEVYIRGVAGERFGVRNSGVNAVVEAVGDHGCEYMTGGKVVILGTTGRNFAAGMSGGIAYILDEAGDFATRCNAQMVGLEAVDDPEEIAELHQLIQNHANYTGSEKAASVLANWDGMLPKFVKVMPKDYKRVLQAIKDAIASGLTGDDALTAAFEANARDVARIGGS